MVAIVGWRRGKADYGFRFGEQFATASQFDRTITVGEEAVVPNSLQAIRQHMQQKATDAYNGI